MQSEAGLPEEPQEPPPSVIDNDSTNDVFDDDNIREVDDESIASSPPTPRIINTPRPIEHRSLRQTQNAARRSLATGCLENQQKQKMKHWLDLLNAHLKGRKRLGIPVDHSEIAPDIMASLMNLKDIRVLYVCYCKI